jgi:hypothetical protein
MATKKQYFDPYGNIQDGYVIDQKTYTDEAGKNRIANGSVVPTDDGLYEMTDNGGVKITLGDMNDLFGKKSTSESTQNQYINDMYAQQTEAAKQALKAAYDANVSTINYQKTAIPETYQVAKNSTAAQSEAQKGNFNEYAAASGLNSGAGGQAQLAFSNTLQGNLSSLDKQQAKATSDLDYQLTQLTTQYQNDIAKAIADGNFQEAQALYDDYKTQSAQNLEQQRYNQSRSDQQDETKYNRALTAAEASGNYSGMAAFGWTSEQIASANKAQQSRYNLS